MTSQAFPQHPDLSGSRRELTGLAGEGQERPLAGTSGQQPLREAVDGAMRRYFAHLDGGEVTGLYAMVMAEVEAPLLAAVLDHTQGNQTRAAEMLGLNRGTLRKKLKQYDLI
ncbi:MULTISPECIES: DNA-binding transcriptional regulator Fis [Halomonas]|jgi:Fis family transcriptional regulator, factor for inversion stimulation protein|uniref:DNA-binding transcriptional regulator Fis n=1 Tax=Halomonas TaxID=2745 RepID=UPI0020B8F0E1|nr:DNA-binding transcriptional regulator Fis [Halomonas sp. 3H]